MKQTKLLGTIITDNLKWHENTKHIVKKSWRRMQLLRKVSSFGASVRDKLDIYKNFIRTHAEQSCTVWSSGLTKGNEKDIERIQKSAVRLILGRRFTTYQEALQELDIETLKERRKLLCAKFAKKCLKNVKTKSMFEENIKKHSMVTRNPLKYKESQVRTSRLQNSAIPFMERLLNS